MFDKFEFKIDAHLASKPSNDYFTVEDVVDYLNSQGLDGWQVVYANRGVIWWMRRIRT